MDTQTLVILGSFLTILLSINAFFLKDILKTLKNLELKFTQLNTEHNIYSALVNKHENELDRCRERIHTLEGAYKQFQNHLGIGE